jgi:proline iminopeptidase
MMRLFRRILTIISIFGLGLLALLIFNPRKYDVLPFEERPNTEYWKLPTGSVIGYQKIEGDSSETKAPIIYLHGGPGGMITDRTIELLRPLSKTGHDLYLYDQIGSGHSERLDHIEEYSVQRHKNDLAAIVNNLKAEKVILLGQSWGAMLAMEYVADHPEKIEKLVFTGPGPILPIQAGLARVKAPDSLQLQRPKFSNREGNKKANNLRSKFIRFCALRFGKKLSSDQEADLFFTYLNNELSKSTQCDPKDIPASKGGRGYYSHIMTVKSFREVKDQRSKLQGLAIPTLLIKGQCDNQPWGVGEEYLKLFPEAELEIIEGAGHIIEIEHQEELLEIITAFLK